MHDACPLLFWTIVITASKHSVSHQDLYTALTAEYTNLLAGSIVKVLRSVSQLHALLIIVMWPLPYPGPTHDPSWGYCGMILNAALQMGMHRPSFHREYGFPDLTQQQVQLRTVTWMMAFQTSVWYVTRMPSDFRGSPANRGSLGTFLGIPPFIDATPHMDAILANPSGLPKIIVNHTDIQRHVARFTLALESATDLGGKVMHINMFERDLERLRTSVESTWSNDMELNVTGARLYLYSHIFVGRRRGSGAAGQARLLLEDSGSRTIIFSGLTTAVKYIHSFCGAGPSSDTSPGASSAPETHRHLSYPHHYWRTLVLASFYLLRILALASEIPAAEQELARNYLTKAYDIFLSYPNSIETLAVAKTIELLVQTTTGVPTENKVTTRLGASIIYDGLLTFSQVQKARSTGMLPQGEPETVGPGVGSPGEMPMTPSIAAYDDFDGGFSLAEFLNTDWDLPWDANFFDIGSDVLDR